MKQNRIELYLLWKCTNDCVFCIETEKKQKYRERVYSLEYISDQLKEESQKGANHVTFLGGEPTLHPNFLEILKTAKSLGYTTSITTNAVRLADKEFVKQVQPYLDEVVVSVHGHNAKSHEQNTRRKGSFDKAQKALDNLNEFYDTLILNCIITKHNYKHLIDVVKFGEKNNIKKIGFGAIDLPDKKGFQAGADRFDEIILSAPLLTDVKPHLLRAFEYADSIGMEVRASDIPMCFLGEYYLKSDDLFYTNRVKIDENNKRQDRKVIPPRDRIQIDICRSCKFKGICKGILAGYYDAFNKKKKQLL